VRGLSAHLLGRRLYETMVYWEGEDENRGPVEREFAEVWRALPRIVFSNTLDAVEGDARLATGSLADEVSALDGDVGVGGAGLAASCIELGLVDEFGVFVYPVIVGGGTPFFPARDHRIDLELLETRTFASRVTYARYRRAH
jgi:dihydrofolate reductase